MLFYMVRMWIGFLKYTKYNKKAEKIVVLSKANDENIHLGSVNAALF